MSAPSNRVANAASQTHVESSDPNAELVAVNLSLPQGSDDAAQGISDNAAHMLPKIVSFKTLARCGEEIWIENDGQIYRLRRTRQGKLILTK